LLESRYPVVDRAPVYTQSLGDFGYAIALDQPQQRLYALQLANVVSRFRKSSNCATSRSLSLIFSIAFS
jgi:hypothetical protein